MPIPSAIIKLTYMGKDVTGRDDERPGNVPIRAWRTMMKHVMFKIGVTWHSRYLPLHFTRAAYFRYPGVYQRRSDSYFWRQTQGSKEKRQQDVERLRAEHLPLVHSGELLQVSQLAYIRAFQTRVTVKIQKLPYVQHNPDRRQPDIIAELSAVNSVEIDVLRRESAAEFRTVLSRFIHLRQLPTTIV